MKTKIACVFFFLFGAMTVLYAQNYSQKEIVLKTLDYKMDIKMDYNNSKLYSVCELNVQNISSDEVSTIPLLLYRLMKVSSVKDNNGNELSFTQQVLSFEDEELLQVNYIEVDLSSPVSSNKNTKIVIEYSGYLAGYTEIGSSYIRDNISPDFTIIRMDTYAYPIVGYPNDRVNRLAGFQSFNYLINVDVPDSLLVANGGKFINKESKEGNTIYTYQNTKPAWRLDIAISDYNILEWNNFKIYYFKEDSVGAKNVMKATKEAYKLYTEWWGDLCDFAGFSIIEIPDDWGSQTDVSCIIQTAASFKDPDNIVELYHEVSHFWNVMSNEPYAPRWNEGLAMFLQYLTEERLTDKRRLEMATNWSFNKIKNKDIYEEIPLVLYGEKGVTDLSYSMGLSMFHILFKLMGEEKFNELIKSYYQKYCKQGSNTEQFIQMAKAISPHNLDAFFNDWFYTTDYVKLVRSGYTVDQFIEHYLN